MPVTSLYTEQWPTGAAVVAGMAVLGETRTYE